MHGQVDKALVTGGERSPRPPRQPQQHARHEVDRAGLGGEDTASVKHVDENIEVGSGVFLDSPSRLEANDVGVEVSLPHGKFPYRAGSLGCGDTRGVGEDSRQRGRRKLGDLDAPHLRAALTILPAISAGILLVELAFEMTGFVIVHQRQTLADRQAFERGEDRRVFLRFGKRTHIDLGHGPNLHRTILCKLGP